MQAATTQPATTPKKDAFRVQRREKRIDIEKAYILRYHKGLTYREIGEYFGVTKSSVFKALKRFERLLPDSAQSETYQANRSEILNGLEWQIVSAMADSGDIKKANLYQKSIALEKVHNMRRLEEDLSTANHSHQTLVLDANNLKSEREKLAKQLDSLQ